ncbi:hypothetical protein KM92DES2_12723 [uncultured Desulfovibrio sp.]|uniref:Uncharacterized protein n=1 Tax=uncultured Desulfovibrio sp. TaxID=167968 RepID=A0A212KCX0_9BACT|nr:hypothetical protein KM92DES2_12723 [uncultured Desulfovibrio sp.]
MSFECKSRAVPVRTPSMLLLQSLPRSAWLEK